MNPSQLIAVSLCVNDPDNGVADGRVSGLSISHLSIDVESGHWRQSDNPSYEHLARENKIRVGRFKYPIFGYRSWVGNWCWDEVALTHDDARRLISHLVDRGFQITMRPLEGEGVALLPPEPQQRMA